MKKLFSSSFASVLLVLSLASNLFQYLENAELTGLVVTAKTKVSQASTLLAQNKARIDRLEMIVIVGTSRPGQSFRETQQIAEAITTYSQEHEIPPKLVASIMAVESAFNCQAVSTEGARGCMQVMPFWANHIPYLQNAGDLFKPVLNIRAGVRIFAHYRDIAKGNYGLALLLYNRGETAVMRDMRAGKNPSNSFPGRVLDRYQRMGAV